MSRALLVMVLAAVVTPRVPDPRPRPAPPEDDWTVAVAAHDLAPGTVIGLGDLYGLVVPAGSAPDGVFLGPKPLLGRVTRETVLAHEPVRAERLVRTDHPVVDVPAVGEWLTTIPMTGDLAASGWVRAGGRVLLYVPSESGKPVAHALRVSSVDRGPQPQVTFVLSTEEAQELATASAVRPLSLELGLHPNRERVFGVSIDEVLRPVLDHSMRIQLRPWHTCAPFRRWWLDGRTEILELTESGVPCH